MDGLVERRYNSGDQPPIPAALFNINSTSGALICSHEALIVARKWPATPSRATRVPTIPHLRESYVYMARPLLRFCRQRYPPLQPLLFAQCIRSSINSAGTFRWNGEFATCASFLRILFPSFLLLPVSHYYNRGGEHVKTLSHLIPCT